jgi:hypothetical protein
MAAHYMDCELAVCTTLPCFRWLQQTVGCQSHWMAQRRLWGLEQQILLPQWYQAYISWYWYGNMGEIPGDHMQLSDVLYQISQNNHCDTLQLLDSNIEERAWEPPYMHAYMLSDDQAWARSITQEVTKPFQRELACILNQAMCDSDLACIHCTT